VKEEKTNINEICKKIYEKFHHQPRCDLLLSDRLEEQFYGSQMWNESQKKFVRPPQDSFKMSIRNVHRLMVMISVEKHLIIVMVSLKNLEAWFKIPIPISTNKF